MKNNLVLITILFLIVACGNNNPQTVESPTAEKIIPTPNTTPTTISSETPVTKSLFPDITYEFPEWIKDLNTPVLAALLENQNSKTRKIAFFNAKTGEKFEIEMPKITNGYFWYDAQNFGLISKDLKTAYKINLLTGTVSSQEVTSESARLLDPDWIHGLSITSDNNGEYSFDDIWGLENSKDKTFTAHRKSDWDGITVTNNLTNEIIWDLTTPKGVYINEYSWSPANNNLLAYIQGKPDPIASDFIVIDVSLNIVDVVTGKIQATYSGDFGRIEWSPDGKMILFQNASSLYSNYGIGFLDAPCILFLNSSDRKCLRSIPKRIPEEYELASTGIYQWEMERNSIFFIYLYWSEAKANYAGELCEYSLVDSSTTCITEKIEELDQRSVNRYSLSPSNEYVYFCISDSSILNDYADFSNDAIMKLDGTGYFSWESVIQVGGPTLCTFNELWRPLP